MIKTFLINLESRPDRLAFVGKQLDDLGLPFRRISAVVGSELSKQQQTLFDKKRFVLEQKKEPVLGEIGCAMSHRLIWQQVQDDDLDFALILEDDISINEQLVDFLNDASNYKNFDFLNLSSNEPYEPNQDNVNALLDSQIVIRPKKWEKSRRLWRKIEWRKRWRIFKLHKLSNGEVACECDPAPALTSGYIVSNKGARALLETSQVMYYPIDLTWRVSGGVLRQGFLVSPLVRQSMNDSDIHGRYIGFRLNLWQRILRFFVKTRRLTRRLDVLKMYGWSRH